MDKEPDIEFHKRALRILRRNGVNDNYVAVKLNWTLDYLRQLQREISVEDDDRGWQPEAGSK